jgi:hypothetical protein
MSAGETVFPFTETTGNDASGFAVSLVISRIRRWFVWWRILYSRVRRADVEAGLPHGRYPY